MKINLQDLKTAIAEIEARTTDVSISIDKGLNHISFTSYDKNDDAIVAILYNDNMSEPKFTITHRLNYMKDKKRI